MVAFVSVLIHEAADGDLSARDVFEQTFFGLFWLALSLGCIWYGDELGEGLTGARYGLISEPSPGWAVQMMGWVLLLVPVVIAVYCWTSSR